MAVVVVINSVVVTGTVVVIGRVVVVTVIVVVELGEWYLEISIISIFFYRNQPLDLVKKHIIL